MGQVLIRNLEDEILADYREAAARNDRSLEAELREALRRMRPLSARRTEQIRSDLAAIRAMTPPVPQTPAEQLVREDRDGFREG
jgi:plasmid stability protein